MERKSFVTVVIFMWIQISETKLEMKRLTSPNFPQYYPRASENDTTDYFSGLSDYRIKVVVKTLDINLKDTLIIYDGRQDCENPSRESVLREFSGLRANETQLPLTFFSRSNGICLNFDRRFGGLDVYKGYEIEIYELPRCRGVMTDEYGDIVSPNYNYEDYQENERCEWRVPDPEPGQAVQFIVQEFNIGCQEGDDVTIIDGRATTSLCQQQNLSPGATFLAENSPVKLKFTSLSRHKGFWVKYKIVGCTAPKLSVKYGSLLNTATYYEYGYRVEYRCAPGYWYGEGLPALYMTCQKNGKWRTEGFNIRKIECQLVNCGDPGTPSNGHRAVSKGQFSYQSTVTFNCDPDFSLEGSRERTCLANGAWSGVQPHCKGKSTECNLPADPPYGSRLGYEAEFGKSVSFRCNDGYKLVGKQEITCLKTGKWSDPVPECQVMTCLAPQPPENGILVSTEKVSFKYGDTVEYQCNTGYRLVATGNGILECLKNGTWDEEPTCEAIMCSTPAAPPNGAVHPTTREYGSEASYSCRRGYTLEGATSTRCGDKGWTGQVPVCKPISCYAPAMPAHGGATWTSLKYGSEARYHCKPGYALDGAPSSFCRVEGWTPAAPVCKPEVCPPLTNDSVPNAYVISADVSQPNGVYHFGQRAQIFCEEGYSMQPREWLTWVGVQCTAGGVWSSDVSKGCPYEVECPPLTDLQPSAEIVTGSETSVSSEAVIVCQVSGRIETITCTSIGEWSVPPSQLCLGERGNNVTDHNTVQGNITNNGVTDANPRNNGTVGGNITNNEPTTKNHNDHDTPNGRTLTSEQQSSDSSWWIIVLAILGSIVVLAAILIILLRTRRRKTPQRESAVESAEKHAYDNRVFGVDPDQQVILSSNGDASFKQRGDDWQSNPTYHNASKTLERPDSMLTDEGIYANPEEVRKPKADNGLTTFS